MSNMGKISISKLCTTARHGVSVRGHQDGTEQLCSAKERFVIILPCLQRCSGDRQGSCVLAIMLSTKNIK